ncbi:MAG: hypothetical protein ABSH32_14425 [Bryobacteraceae bacterium]
MVRRMPKRRVRQREIAYDRKIKRIRSLQLDYGSLSAGVILALL